MMNKKFTEKLIIDNNIFNYENVLVDVIDSFTAKFNLKLEKSRKRKFNTVLAEIIQNIEKHGSFINNYTNSVEINYYYENDIFNIKSTSYLVAKNKVYLENRFDQLTKLNNDQLSIEYDKVLHNDVKLSNISNKLGVIYILKNSKLKSFEFKKIEENIYNYTLNVDLH